MDYFDLQGLRDYSTVVDKSYNSRLDEARWFYNTREKLYFLVDLLSKKLDIPFKIVYKEKPNGQKGRGNIVFKDYILAGFAPKDYEIGDDLFLKVSLAWLGLDPKFGLNIDLNYKKTTSPFHNEREKIYNQDLREIPIDNNFPDNWVDLVNLILPDIQKMLLHYEDYVKSLNTNKSKPSKMISLNQILYGPPGTGKTYDTKELAVKIVNPKFFENERQNSINRELLNNEYKRLLDQNQIIFTTFHQSYSYEDFVEGIKPETLEGKISYDVVPGLFRELCEKADTKSNSNFEDVLKRFKDDLEGKGMITIDTGSIIFDVFYTGGKTFKINPRESKNTNPMYPASIQNLLKLYKNAPDEGMYNPSYVRGILNYLYKNYNLIPYEEVKEGEDKSYVLIIDEINRGNVSQIFGELITLLEPDKRIGGKEEIKIKLPYSKTFFGVPKNIYIIGTMNTADRSVEALDTALRRRFSFVEMMPKPELLSPSAIYCRLLWEYRDISWDDTAFLEKENKLFSFLGVSEKMKLERKKIWDKMIKDGNPSKMDYFKDYTYTGIDLKSVLEKINQRIEQLMDRDHTIGHSYFMGITSLEDLANGFKDKVIPLLQEYFYGDYGKMGLVLGEGFVDLDTVNKTTFAKFTYPDFREVNSTKYTLKEITKDNIKSAIDGLLNDQADSNNN